MFYCCKKRKKIKIIPKKRTDSYSEFMEVCINDWKKNNKDVQNYQIAPKPPTPISSVQKYIKIKKKKNEKNLNTKNIK